GRLFTIQDDYLRAGWGHDFTQLLMLPAFERLRVALFDHAGHLLRTEERAVDQSGAATLDQREQRRVAVRDAWLAELGYDTATIEVRRFSYADGAGVTDFNWWAGACDRPDDEQREEAREWMKRWLARGKYRFSWVGDDAWFDRDGEVTDT